VTVAESFGLMTRSLTWDDLGGIAADAGVPLLVKGLLAAEDAVLAVEHGAAGVVVSNHGGRQLDRSMTGAEALPEVVEAVAGRATVLVDGGIRRGVDIAVALALGADAVLLGRPTAWGLAAAGAAGAERVLRILAEELELALALLGLASPAGLGPEHLRSALPTRVYSGREVSDSSVSPHP
jgi:4-hydroxymandelate oxidase